MLDYNILSQKPIIKAVKNGKLEEYVDLLSRTYNGNIVERGRILEVEEYYIARPDLISLAVYGDDKYADILCKINGISNPFELNKGMIIYAPEVTVLNNALSGKKYNSDILDEFKHLSSTDKNIYASDYRNDTNEETIEKKKSNLQKYKNERRTPGEQTVTDNNYIIDRSLGVVIY